MAVTFKRGMNEERIKIQWDCEATAELSEQNVFHLIIQMWIDKPFNRKRKDKRFALFIQNYIKLGCYDLILHSLYAWGVDQSI